MWSKLLLASLLFGCVAQSQPVNPDIHVNNLTGTNGQASGAPSGTPAIFRALGCSTVGASTTIQAPTHGMGALPTDGSSALWLNTAAGRRWTKITGFPSGDTITVADSFNIAAAVDCAAAGQIAGTLKNVTRLCEDLKQGWTLTIENTGTDYTDSGGQCNIATTGTVATDGRIVVKGDDPANPTRILWQTNSNYINQAGANSTKIENLEFVKDAAGTTGAPVLVATNGGVFKNSLVSNQTGTWNSAWIDGGRPVIVFGGQYNGPFTSNCVAADDDDLIAGNAFLGCSGSGAAAVTGRNFLFNILDNEGDNAIGFGASTGLLLFNTGNNIGGSGVEIDSAFAALVSGNLLGEASTLSGACFTAGTSSVPQLMGIAGQPHLLWQGNSANECSTARYANNVDISPQGAPADIDGGNQIDPTFQDELNLDFFPLNGAEKSDTVFPGVTWVFQTTGAPESITTAGAAQRPGQAGVTGYAY